MQFDEKWAFVAKKQKNCDPDGGTCGNGWDHVALDPETQLVVSSVVGKRTAGATHALVGDVHRRACDVTENLGLAPGVHLGGLGHIRSAGDVTADWAPPQRTHGGAAGGTCATVRKERENNRVVAMSTRVVFETAVAVAAALVGSTVSHVVNTCFVERHNGTARNRCRRKARKGYAFSKDWDVHRAATVFRYFSYNLCWPARTLRVKGDDCRYRKRTPAMPPGSPITNVISVTGVPTRQ